MKFAISSSAVAALLSLAGTVQAGLFPSVPAPKQVIKPGEKIAVTWSKDTTLPQIPATGNIEVFFMTGPDQTQTKLQTVGTVPVTATTVDWVVPTVEPAGLIYFMMFTAGANNYWTTRFIVTNPDGTYPPPPTVTYASGKNPGGQGRIISNGTEPALAASASGSPVVPVSAVPTTLASPLPANNATSGASTASKPASSSTPAKNSAISSVGNPMGAVAVGAIFVLSTALLFVA